MEEQNANQSFQTWFLALAILAVFSCIPLSTLLSGVLTLVVLGISIYLFVKLFHDRQRRRGPFLLVIAGALEIVCVIFILIAMLGVRKSSLSFTDALTALTQKSKDPHYNLMTMGGEIFFAMMFAVASWIVRVVGTVFTFIGYNREKKLTAGDNDQA